MTATRYPTRPTQTKLRMLTPMTAGMTVVGWLEAIGVFLIVWVSARPLGMYLVRVFQGERVACTSLLQPVERLCYRLIRIDPLHEMSWQEYACAIFALLFIELLYLTVLFGVQGWLPLNRDHIANLTPTHSIHVALAMLAGMPWHDASDNHLLSYLAETIGLNWQRTISIALNIAVAIAMIRAFTRAQCATVGNFWVDLIRGMLYLALPIALGISLFFFIQTTLESLAPSMSPATLIGSVFVYATMLMAHIRLVAMFLLGAALTAAFGISVRDHRQGWSLFATMSLLFFASFDAVYASESMAPPPIHHVGIAESALYTTMKAATSSNMFEIPHAPLPPLTRLALILILHTGQIIFGGGIGFIRLLAFVILAAFLAGLLVGRTPEYVGKIIDRRIMYSILCALFLPLCSSLFSIVFSALIYLSSLAIYIPALAATGAIAKQRTIPITANTFSTSSLTFLLLLVTLIVSVSIVSILPLTVLQPVIEHARLLQGTNGI